MTTDWIRYETAGYADEADELHFIPGPSRCGEIEDGVAFSHGHEGGWVLPFTALQDAYFRAAEERRMSVEHIGRAYLAHLDGEPAEAKATS